MARYVSFLIHGSDGLFPSRRWTGACAGEKRTINKNTPREAWVHPGGKKNS
jgi:hypothetical protein